MQNPDGAKIWKYVKKRVKNEAMKDKLFVFKEIGFSKINTLFPMSRKFLIQWEYPQCSVLILKEAGAVLRLDFLLNLNM